MSTRGAMLILAAALRSHALALSVMQNAGTGSVSFSKHGNGLVEVRLEGGEPEMYDGLAAVLDECGESEGLVLRIGKAPCSNGLAQLSANLKSADLQATLRRMRSDGRPVIAIADDDLCGAAAGLFLAASERVCTSTTIFSLPECSVGLCPTTAPALRALGTELHMASYAALTGAQLTAHDCTSLRLATHFTSRDQTLDLVNELRYCPARETAVPLRRRTEPAPRMQASLFAEEVGPSIDAALRDVFGDEAEDAAVGPPHGPDPSPSPPSGHASRARAPRPLCGSRVRRSHPPRAVQDCAARLRAQLERARPLTQSSAWRTRECADAVVDILDSAERTMRTSSPSALEATFAVMRRSSTDADMASAQQLALSMNENLSGLDDFKEALSGDGKPRWLPAASFQVG